LLLLVHHRFYTYTQLVWDGCIAPRATTQQPELAAHLGTSLTASPPLYHLVHSTNNSLSFLAREIGSLEQPGGSTAPLCAVTRGGPDRLRVIGGVARCPLVFHRNAVPFAIRDHSFAASSDSGALRQILAGPLLARSVRFSPAQLDRSLRMAASQV